MPDSRTRSVAPRQRRRAIKGHVLLDDKTKRRLSRIRLRRVVIVLAAVGIVVGAVALYRSPLLRVQDVQVVGAKNVDAAEVQALAGLEGRTMLDLPLDRVEERVGALPMVKSVETERRWPDGVRITISERAPWGTWRIGKASYVIDTEGVVLPEAIKAPKGGPLIEDRGAPARLVPGDRVDVDAVAVARSLLKSVPEALGLKVAALEYTPEAGLSLLTDSGYSVVMGDSQNLDYKLAVWQAVENDLGRQAMTGHVLDLRFENRPSFQ